MNNIKRVLLILGVMGICYAVGYCMGAHNTNTKWQIERAKNWRPVIG